MDLKTKLSVLEYFRNCPPDSPAIKLVYDIVIRREMGSDPLPSCMRVEGDTLVYGDQAIHLTFQPRIRKVFEIFLAKQESPIDREELTSKVYEVSDLRSLSIRQQESLRHNTVKLVSRARHLLMCNFRLDSKTDWEWFPYCKMTKTWKLYRFRS